LSAAALDQWSENVADCENDSACIESIWPTQPTAGTQVSVNDCLPKMIIHSDNICGKFFLDYGRNSGLYNLLSSMGYTHTSLAPGELQTSASDVAKLLTSIAQNKFINQEDSGVIYGLMKKQAHRAKIPAGITSAEVANKTGEIHTAPYYSHDAAIVKSGDKTFIIVIMTGLNPDSSADDSAIAKLAGKIFAALGGQAGDGTGTDAGCTTGKTEPTITSTSLQTQLQWPWYVTDEGGGSNCSDACVSGNGTLADFVPEPYNSAFTQAGKKHNVAPELIAALFTAENMTHIDPAKIPGEWKVIKQSHPDAVSTWPTNEFHTMGAFQFLPSTWGPPVNMGEDGDGDGNKDANNIYDAAAGAAKYAETDGATLDKPVDSWRTFIFSYNHADWYVDMVMDYYKYYVKQAPGSPTDDTTASCGTTGVSTDGFVFPQITTKAALAAPPAQPQYFSPTCVNPVHEMGPGRMDGLCHHDYLAADISNKTGTPVVAPRPGRVVSAHDTDSVGASVRIYSDKALGGDGLWYYLCHMLTTSEGGGTKVRVNQVIKAGDQLGVVGTSADAEHTHPHTHIDISPVDNGFHRGYDGTAGPLLDPQPALKASYDNLPAK
jgi:murein DD-endopeptidase MepM/ murein hydrolase activator NlpD